MQVLEVQRARILAAMVRVVAAGGLGSATVARVVSRAGVSRRTFYELFTSCEDCFLAVFEDTIRRVSGVATDAVAQASSSDWREQVRAGLGALLVCFDEEPAAGSLLVVDALGGGPRVLERRTRVLEELTTIVDRGRDAQVKSGRRSLSSPSSSSSSSSLVAEGVVGAVFGVIHARMLERAAERSVNGVSARSRGAPVPLIGLLNPLMGMIVLPYLGRAAARKELSRPMLEVARPLDSSGVPHKPSGDLLEGLNMRLTYRTLVVLSAIATDPGASNRQIADRAGVRDQGQISKLLGRLEKLGLIHNTGQGQPTGEPNAWTLTPQGTQVQQVFTHGR